MSKQVSFEAEQALIDLGQRLATARQRRGWRQADVAEKVKLARATVQKIEAGNPGVAIGNYAMLLALYSAVESLGDVCKAEDDIAALDLERPNKRVRAQAIDNDF